MRYILGALVIALTIMYFTVGVRVGYVTLMPTYMWNATGLNEYAYRTLEDRQQVTFTGKCNVKSGTATLGLYAPDGSLISGQACRKGNWSLNMTGGGRAGAYHLKIDLSKFTGNIEVNQAYAEK